MSLSETELIERYFYGLGAVREDVLLGIGDDAALLRVSSDEELVLTTDALVEGVHFLPDAPPHSLGYRALAVNLSDIAAMGGRPQWALLALNLPAAEEPWLQAFAAGFGELAQAHEVALVGGNISRGPLSITVQLAGTVPHGQALRRDGAREGDALYVSGSVGDAAAGLKHMRGHLAAIPAAGSYLRQRFEYPTPRVKLGTALLVYPLWAAGLVTACFVIVPPPLSLLAAGVVLVSPFAALRWLDAYWSRTPSHDATSDDLAALARLRIAARTAIDDARGRLAAS